jgi:hypothetical protein
LESTLQEASSEFEVRKNFDEDDFGYLLSNT